MVVTATTNIKFSMTLESLKVNGKFLLTNTTRTSREVGMFCKKENMNQRCWYGNTSDISFTLKHFHPLSLNFIHHTMVLNGGTG